MDNKVTKKLIISGKVSLRIHTAEKQNKMTKFKIFFVIVARI